MGGIMPEITSNIPLDRGICADGGEMGALMRATFVKPLSRPDGARADDAHPLGMMADWPSSLKTAINICLNSCFPMVVWWGTDFRLLYNDAFRPILGSDRSSQALGQPAQFVFAESWHIIGPQLRQTVETKQANQEENLLIPVRRAGYLEESYYTYSYSPLLDEAGEVSGVFTVINETTQQILSERRLSTSTQLAEQAGALAASIADESQTTQDLYQSIVKTLSENPADIPFAALYRLNSAKNQAMLCGRTPAATEDIWLPERMDFTQQDPWQVETVLHAREAIALQDLPERFGRVPTGVFDLPVTGARVMPVRALSLTGMAGLLIVGLNPARQMDEEYESFLDLLAGHIASALANANNRSTEKALRISEERFRSFVESNVVGILVGDASGTISEANDEFLRIVGYSREDLRSGRLRWTTITPSEYFSADQAGIDEAKRTGSCTPYEKEYVRKDGRRVPVLLGYTLAEKTHEQLVAFILDMSDRKKIEAALQQREIELQLVTDSLPVLISFVDVDQRYRFNNKAYEEWFGCPAAEMYGKSVREMMGEAAYQKISPYIQRVLSGETVTYEDEFFSHAGDSRFLSVTYVPRTSSKGAIDGFVVMISDVSDRKKNEIEKEQLLQREHNAREAAERANRIKDEFLAVVSHELRTPMNPILGWSQLLKRGSLSPPKTAQALESIERNARSQVQLIDDLLDISRVLRGKMNLTENPIDLSNVVTAGLETIRLAAEAKSIKVTTALSPCAINGDEGRLQQVVWNLLSNAIKFTPESGEVVVSLRAEARCAVMTVADTGKGITAEFLPYVFEHFRQEDYSTTRQFGGLGLGLAISRQIVELHGGSIAVESKGEDQGATFTVKIPLADPILIDLPVKVSSSDSGNLYGLQILVVDDEVDSQEITAYALTQAGAQVITVSSGVEALAAIAQQPLDLLISDIGMPEMDGYMLMQRVRALPSDQGGGLKAIALTAYAGEIDVKRAFASGFQCHVSKPVDPGRLLSIIGELWKGTDATAKAARNVR